MPDQLLFNEIEEKGYRIAVKSTIGYPPANRLTLEKMDAYATHLFSLPAPSLDPNKTIIM